MTAFILQYRLDWYKAISRIVDWDEIAIIFLHIIDKKVLLNLEQSSSSVSVNFVQQRQQGKIRIVSNGTLGLHQKYYYLQASSWVVTPITPKFYYMHI